MPGIFYNNLPPDTADLSDQASNLALGQFMTAWSQVESIIRFLFAELCGAKHEPARIILDEVQATDRIIILRRLAAIADDATRRSLEPLISQADTLSKRRNRIVHAGWGRLTGARARFWHGLTIADFTEIHGDTPKGQSLRTKSIFTINDIVVLTGKAATLARELKSAHSRLSSARLEAELLESRHRRSRVLFRHRYGLEDPDTNS